MVPTARWVSHAQIRLSCQVDRLVGPQGVIGGSDGLDAVGAPGVGSGKVGAGCYTSCERYLVGVERFLGRGGFEARRPLRFACAAIHRATSLS